MDFGIAQPIDGSNGSDGSNCPPRDAKATSRNLQPAFPAHLPMWPPEVANGACASVASELFAAGIVLHEMFTGAPPIVSGNAYETIHRMAQNNFAPLSSRNNSDDHAAAKGI